MKLLRYVFFRNCRTPGNKLLKDLCHFSILNVSTIYAAILGILGVSLSMYDIYQVITHGATLPCNILRSPLKDTKLVSPEIERDLKLIGLVLSLEYYLLLVIGAVAKNGTFFVPWMIFYSIVITLEFLIFLSKTFNKGLELERHNLILSIFVVYNWLAIFCAFLNISGAGCG